MPTFLAKDQAVLVALKAYRGDAKRRKSSFDFARIMDIAQASALRVEYASAMKRLVVLGLVERRQRTDVPRPPSGLRSRASWEYRITDAGLAFLEDGRPEAGSEKLDDRGCVPFGPTPKIPAKSANKKVGEQS